nr:hypothetical protein CFP56_21264 [Quercus suber]
MLWGTVRPDKSLGTERCDNVKRKPAAEETTMAPHVEVFDASRLDHAIQYKPNGRRHRPNIDLKACALKELLQYECDLNGPRHDPRTKVVCEPDGSLRGLRTQHVNVAEAVGDGPLDVHGCVGRARWGLDLGSQLLRQAGDGEGVVRVDDDHTGVLATVRLREDGGRAEQVQELGGASAVGERCQLDYRRR